MGASIKEVATRAGVSLGTVSNVLNRPARVAPATRKLVLDAIAELGYVRNESARQLRSGQGRILGLVVLDGANPFFSDIARGAEDAASAGGFAVMLCNSDDSVQRENTYLDLFEQLRVPGVLIAPVDESLERVQQVVTRGVHAVLLDAPGPLSELCSVGIDDVLGGELAATHLLAMGHRDIAYVAGPMSMRQCRDRHDGVVRAFARSGADPDQLVVIEQAALNVTAGQRAAERLLTQRPRPTAVFCANDLLALGVLQTLLSLGVDVPGDMALVGYDDIEFAAAAAVPLTSVRQPRRDIGRTAVQLLVAEINGEDDHEHQHVVFEPGLSVRRSSGAGPRRA